MNDYLLFRGGDARRIDEQRVLQNGRKLQII